MKTTMLCLLAAAALGTAPLARADDAAVRKELQTQYDRLIQAMKAKDINGVMSVAAPGFTEKQPGMPAMNAAQAKAAMEEDFKMTKSLDSASMKVVKVSVKGNTAVATTDYKMAGTGLMNGKEHKMTDRGTSRDTWVKTPQGWKVKSVVFVQSHPMMDGRPMTMGAPPSSGAGSGHKPHKR